MARHRKQSSRDLAAFSDERPLLNTPLRANFLPTRQQEADLGASRDHNFQTQALGMRNERPEMTVDPSARHLSLTPSMSASNIGSLADDSAVNPSGARIYETLAQSHEKLLSSKEKYDLHPSIYLNIGPEEDDALHDPGQPLPRKGRGRYVQDSRKIKASHSLSALGLLNIVAIVLIALVLLGIFAGLPIAEYFARRVLQNNGAFGLGGTNATGQVPEMAMSLVDQDTPSNKRGWTNDNGDDYVLVFSDEFNVDGRTFYDGDDPFWLAQDLHYYGTNDLERYRPGQVTTGGGNLIISMNQTDPDTNGGLGYISGMLQSWNKMCFTGGYIEVNVSLPGDGVAQGFWPAAWTMGNLGRAGFGGTTDGTWPFSYDTCDVGTLHNQTNFGSTTEPAAAVSGGDKSHGGELSFLPGQKLSACTCPNSDHPGPSTSNGGYKGRSAPEIDILEAMTTGDGSVSSQSFQLAPFNAEYTIPEQGTTYYSDNGFSTVRNSYEGGVFQQAASGLSTIPDAAFNGGFMTVAFDYSPSDSGSGYITWYQNGVKTWTITDDALAAEPISNEPMYMILNFGMSNGFGKVELNKLPFPSQYRVDYVRVYQKSGSVNYGCDGAKGDYPTTQYIQDHIDIYSNNNITLWSDGGLAWPKNSLEGGC